MKLVTAFPASPRLLRRLELSGGNSPLRVQPSGERLLACLAVRRDLATRPEAAAALWPDCPDARAASNLRSVLWRQPGHSEGAVVSTRAGKLALALDVAVDLAETSGRLAGRAAIGHEVSTGLLPQELGPGWPETWLITTREWFRQVRLRALEKMCDQHRDAGHADSALAAGLATVACDPLRDSAHRRLALIRLSEGNLAVAPRQYHVYRELDRPELGLPPSSQFRRFVAPLMGLLTGPPEWACRAL
jgi:DNA-binding SARP family transcriptional activator